MTDFCDLFVDPFSSTQGNMRKLSTLFARAPNRLWKHQGLNVTPSSSDAITSDFLFTFGCWVRATHIEFVFFGLPGAKWIVAMGVLNSCVILFTTYHDPKANTWLCLRILWLVLRVLIFVPSFQNISWLGCPMFVSMWSSYFCFWTKSWL